MFHMDDKHDDRSRRFAAAILVVLRWEADGIYQRSDTRTYTCMCAALGEVTSLGAATPLLDQLLHVMETGDSMRDVSTSWEGAAAAHVWSVRHNIGLTGDRVSAEPLDLRVERARAACRLAVARGLDLRRYAVHWFGSSVYRGVLLEGWRGDPEVLLPWADVEAERLAVSRGG